MAILDALVVKVWFWGFWLKIIITIIIIKTLIITIIIIKILIITILIILIAKIIIFIITIMDRDNMNHLNVSVNA